MIKMHHPINLDLLEKKYSQEMPPSKAKKGIRNTLLRTNHGEEKPKNVVIIKTTIARKMVSLFLFLKKIIGKPARIVNRSGNPKPDFNVPIK